MVVSFSNNFIFLRLPKNASTSVAAYFVKNACDNNDVWTRINDAGVGDHNISPSVIAKHKHDYHFIHMTLNEIVHENIITLDQARSMDVINIIRDPFERQLSLYFWKQRGNRSPEDFRKQFKNGYHANDISNKITQYDYGCVAGEHVAKCWLYDDIERHLQQFCSDRNLPNPSLNTYKSTISDKKDMSYYDEETYAAVAEYYAKDIELYNRLKNEN